jgi:hypothetical protein
VNGGWCCQRSGFWSQSVAEVVVSLPTLSLRAACKSLFPDLDPALPLSKSSLEIKFHPQSVSILSSPPLCSPQCLLHLPLLHVITPSACLWSLETHHQRLFLVLYLTKSLSHSRLSPPTPGAEWWESICEDDERIDTLLCTIGSNLSELPSHAKERAEREHRRFQSLSSHEQDTEQQHLMALKEQFAVSLQRTEVEREGEERTMREVPERAEFLRKLRSEFPQIAFVSK